jgi:hypothetical protein
MKKYLQELISEQLSKESLQWLDEHLVNAGSPEGEMKTYQAFAKIPSITGKTEIFFTNKTLKGTAQPEPFRNLKNLRMDQAARILLLLSLPLDKPLEYNKRLKKFFELADMNELETICLGLPLYPFPALHVELAKQGIRSNIKTVFEAIAINNSYPSNYFDNQTWNQMMLKAIFLECPVYKIYGVDKRANSELARMLCDYAEERWAAGRKVNPELWRSVAPFINAKKFTDIEKVFNSENRIQHEAAGLACFTSYYPPAHRLLESDDELKIKIKNNEVTWNTIAKKWHEEKETVY